MHGNGLRGGQGRDDQDIYSAGYVLCVLALAGFLGLILALAWRLCEVWA